MHVSKTMSSVRFKVATHHEHHNQSLALPTVCQLYSHSVLLYGQFSIIRISLSQSVQNVYCSALTGVAREYNCISAVPVGSTFTVLCPAVEEFTVDHLVSFDDLSNKLSILASGTHVTFDIL